MKYYTQNDEERVIVEYFGNKVGNLVDIGANDGETFSNSARLIEMGWKAWLVEPHKGAVSKCQMRYVNNGNVDISNVAIGDRSGNVAFHSGSDSLLSTVHADMKSLWPTTTFDEESALMVTWDEFMKVKKIGAIDFISIDAEGCDWSILQQIDLTNVKMLCIEVGDFKTEIMKYCFDAGMQKVHQTFENIIFAR